MVLVFSSIFKLLALKKYLRALENYEFIPGAWKSVIGYGSPVVELLTGFALIWLPHEFFVNLVALGMFFVFLAIHVHAVLKNDKSTCMCFGEIIKSRYGMPGIIQSVLLIISILPNLLIVYPVSHNQLFVSYGIDESAIALVLACLWGLNLITARLVLDKILYR